MSRRKGVIITLSVITVLVVLLVVYLSVINPILVRSTSLMLDSIAKKAINEGINQITDNRAIYDDLININYNDIGHISMIQIKSYEANTICNKIIINTEKAIDELGDKGFQVKSGLFSTIPILSGLGKNITFHFQQIGSVTCSYASKFVSAGVNQTLHRLYVDINTKLSVVLPFHTEVVDVSQSVLLCENIIIGDIPYTYLQSTELDSILNLVPT